AKKSEPWGNEKTGFILTYRPEVGSTLKYDFTINTEMLMEVMGNEMETTSDVKARIFSKVKDVAEDGAITFGMGFDSISVTASSPQGEMSPDMSKYIGKELEVKISNKGKFLEMKNQELFPPVEGSYQSVSSYFRNFFFDLSEKSVKINDSWTSTDSYTEKVGENETNVNTSSKYTVVEKLMKDNTECLKIAFEQTSEIKGKGTQMGMDFTMDGTSKSKGEILFAYRKGYYIEVSSTGTLEATVSMTQMEIPMSGTIKTSIKLIK
ncbi:hypothetical protein DRQ09_00920, partial [candidate division KSB1 bacterium]